jgi:hypothetical protein
VVFVDRYSHQNAWAEKTLQHYYSDFGDLLMHSTKGENDGHPLADVMAK